MISCGRSSIYRTPTSGQIEASSPTMDLIYSKCHKTPHNEETSDIINLFESKYLTYGYIARIIRCLQQIIGNHMTESLILNILIFIGLNLVITIPILYVYYAIWTNPDNPNNKSKKVKWALYITYKVDGSTITVWKEVK